ANVFTALINPSLVNFHVENTTFSLGGPNFPMTPAFFAGAYTPGNPTFSIDLKNCILANTTAFIVGPGASAGTLTGDHNGFYNSPPAIGTSPITTTMNPFQSVGGGNGYLEANTVLRNAGTLTITPSLLTELRERTTDAPIYLTGQITTPRTLGQ